ncbi:unnamed protein product [Litomosoides sigmodontis]|uniref:DNA repair and recombination protein RAD54-like n=1 Tax=Litomosoides sigmodontis TaxID=42156 RepID=A0A3P6UX64_LITSI|nr:unnamed protein product [Litomosoides sigmodontis]
MKRRASECEQSNTDDITVSSDNDNDVMKNQDDEMYSCYEVLYGKISARLHKRWIGDGLLYCRQRSVILQTENGEEVARAGGFSIKQLSELKAGSHLQINDYEVQIQTQLESRRLVVGEAENTEKQQEAAELYGESSKKLEEITGQDFISPLSGLEDSLDFVLDEIKDDDGSDRQIAVDLQIARHLKPHQKDGITFMYKCLKDSHGGAILADEIGLGKNVQTISLIAALTKKWLNQKALIERCVIAVPTSLLNNWYAEFMKWSPQIRPMLFRILKSADIEKLISYQNTPVIAIVSYNMIARVGAKLSTISIDLLVCDEVQKLKHFNARFQEQFRTLNAKRRLLLTGASIQNDLEEFYSLINFARPDLFNDFSEFKSLYETGTTHFNELLDEVMLRRTGEMVDGWLPPKSDYLVWCQPSPLQRSMYESLKKFLSNDPLNMIDTLRTLCNHPSILYRRFTMKLRSCEAEEKELYSTLLGLFPNTYNDFSLSITDSGKLSVFGELLGTFREQEEKIVIVSNLIDTLDLLEELARTLYYTVLRVDSSTDAKQRLECIEQFNSPSNKHCAFILSGKAGGFGLNLVAASRMILFDLDWDPAVDTQAMSCVWREGQQRPCHIYRLITAGTVDETIFQRQFKKSGLNARAEMVSAEDKFFTCSNPTHFSDKELQNLFALREGVECETHYLLGCQCSGCGVLPHELETIDVDPAENSASEVDTENVITTQTEGLGGTNDSTSVPEDSVQSSAGLTQDCSDSVHDHDSNEMLKDETELEDQNALMGTLMRWKHYSPKHESQFESMKAQAGLEECCLDEISFVMKIISNM